MKMFVIAALIAVAAAGRLEHLERSYLPPDNSIISARSSFGSGPGNGFGTNSGAFRAAGAGLPSHNAGSFAGATSNQYLPPNYGSSASGGSQFAGSLQGFGAQNYRSQPSSQQYSIPSTQYGTPQAHSSFGSNQAQFSQQSATSRQYLAPSFQSTSQQAFDEETGYQYGAPQARSSFGARSYQANPQFAATSRQYLAPSSSFQNPPQQAFDEETGYQY